MAPDGTATANDDLDALVASIVERDGVAPAGLADGVRLQLARSLKDACYAAWSTEPQRTVHIAEALRALDDGPSRSGEAREIGALAQWTAGIAKLTRGEMEEAIGCLADAAGRFRALARTGEAAQAEVPTIVALAMLGRHEEAVATAGRVQAELERAGDQRAAAKVSLNLGSLHLRRDRHAEAARHYRDAAVRFARARDHEHSIMADIGLADALTALGDFDEALRMYARAGMRAATHGFPVLEAIRDESVGLLELARGRHREALEGIERARRRYESLAMPHHLAVAEKQLGDAYLELRLLPEALALYEQAIAVFERHGAADDAAWTLVQRGRVQALQARTGAAAESLARAARAFEGQENEVGATAVVLAQAELALACADPSGAHALAQSATGRFEAAGLAERAARAEAVGAEAQVRSGAHGRALARFVALRERARALGIVDLEVRCLAGEGACALAAGDRTSARIALEAAVDLFEELRRTLPGDDLRSAFLTDHLAPYRGLVRLALDAHAHEPAPGNAARVLASVDRFRGRAIAEQLGSRDATRDDARVGHARTRVAWLQGRLQRAYENGEACTSIASELRRAERELLERARRQRLVSGTQAGGADDHGLDVDALCAVLGPGDALVEYGVLDDELFACVVRRDGIVVRRSLASWSVALDALRAARFQLETLRHGGDRLAHRLDALAERARVHLAHLHAQVWAPLEAALDGCMRVVVVAHGELAALPYAALHDGACFLAERIELAAAPSARLALRSLAREPAALRTALAVGVGSGLPHVADEVSAIARLFPAGTSLVGTQATLDAFRAGCSDADVIHLACHAQFRTDHPMFSALYLHDGALAVESVERLRLRAGIVVLGACETALAQQGAGDEMVGLVRAFLVAGAGRVLASLWPVDDAITDEAMRSFHGALAHGATPSAALRAAQRGIMARHPHPFHWAAFALYGGW